MSKSFSKYIAAFYYFNKTVLVFSEANGGVSIASFASLIETPVGITRTSFSLVFCISNGIMKKKVKNND